MTTVKTSGGGFCDIDIENMDQETLEDLCNKAKETLYLRAQAKEDESKNKFLKSAAALKLKERVKQLQEEFKSFPKSTTVKFEIELSIALKPRFKVDELFNSGTLYREDLFYATYKGKIVNAKQLGSQTNLQATLDSILDDACIDAIDYDKDLGEKTQKFVEKLNTLVGELNDNLVESADLLKGK